MQVQDIMTRSFESISRDAAIRKAAEQMRDLDVGMLPVSENEKIVGAVTDRDITIRATANGSHPDNTSVSDVMTSEAFSCNENDDLQQAAHIMEEHQIRRLLVKNSQGDFVGVLALADLARHHELEHVSAEVLEEVSQPGTQSTPH